MNRLVIALAFALGTPISSFGAAIVSTWASTSGNWNVAGNWAHDMVFAGFPNNGGGNTFTALVNNGFTATIPSGVDITLNALGITNSRVVVASNVDLTINAGTISNNGNLDLAGGAAFSRLLFGAGTTTISGTGALNLSDSTNNQIRGSGANTATLVNGTGHTIRGSGNIGLGITAIQNDGTIRADQATTLVLQPGTGGFINSGTLEANGGTLRLQGGNFSGNGTLRSVGNSRVELNNTTITGAKFETPNSGLFTLVSAATLNGGATIGAGATLQVGNGTDLTLGAGVIDQTGAINLEAGAALTRILLAAGTATFQGTGVLELSNSPNNQIRGLSANAAVIENAAGHVIQGSGNIGVGITAIDNKGIIRASSSTGLTLAPGSGGGTNSGVIEANGGTLKLQGTWTNTGSFNMENDSVLELSASTVLSGASFTSSTTGRVEIASNARLNGGATIGANVALNVGNGEDLALGLGTINHIGTLNVQGAAGLTRLMLEAGTVVFAGTGDTVLSDSVNNQIRGFTANTATMHNAAGHTIRGSGNLGAGITALINDGHILADQSAALLLQPGSGGLINNGEIEANGGTVTLLGATLNNGTLRAENGSAFNLSPGAVLTAGNFVTSSSGVVNLLDGSNLAGGLAADAGITIRLANAADVDLAAGSTYSHDGIWEINSQGSLTRILLENPGDVTLGGPGRLVLSNSASNQIRSFASGVTNLVNGDGHTIEGSGNIGVGITRVTNDGIIVATNTTPLIINANAQGFTNNGTLRAQDGALLDIINVFNNYNATTDVLTGGTYHAVNGGRIRFAGADVRTNAASILLDGLTSRLEDATGLNALRNLSENQGTLHLVANHTLNTSGNLLNTGTVIVGANTQLNPANGAGTYRQTSGSTVVDGTLSASSIQIEGGAVTGNGTLDGSTSNTGGVIGPGNSPGLLTIDGSYIQTLGGQLLFEIAGRNPGEFDMLNVLGNVTFDNTAGVNSVVLQFLAFDAMAGDSFTVLKYLSANYLSFSALLPTLKTGLVWRELRNPTDLTYQVVLDPSAVPEPATFVLAAAALGALALARRRSR